MCKSVSCDGFKDGDTKKYRLADFFDAHWEAYMKSPKEFVRPEQLKAVNAMRACRTAVLGVEIHACPECGEITPVYHSCKNRFCPTCSWRDTMKWAEKVKGKMMNVKHRHIVCTVPHGLHPLIKKNRRLLLSALMRASAKTFTDYLGNRYNVKAGVILVLHTFGETKDYHVHTHMIVSWGGICIKTGVLKEIENEFVNYEFIQKKFRCKFEDELIGLYDNGELVHDFTDRRSFMNFIKHINKKDWRLHLEPGIDLPEKVIRYIGRYSKRACLSEYKITSIEGEYISFKYKDNKDLGADGKPKEKVFRMHYSDFFPRLLQHVPLPYFRIVRYYGVYSNHGKIPEEYFSKPQEEVTEITEEELNKRNPLYCDHCQQEKVYIMTIFDKRSRKERSDKYKIAINREDGVKRRSVA
jgi:putative transposase/transposase-like zinc-binding protein